MVNRDHPLQPGSHSLIQLPGLEIPVHCVATDAKLSGQHRLWLPGLRSLFQVGYLVAAQDLGASSIDPSTFLLKRYPPCLEHNDGWLPGI